MSKSSFRREADHPGEKVAESSQTMMLKLSLEEWVGIKRAAGLYYTVGILFDFTFCSNIFFCIFILYHLIVYKIEIFYIFTVNYVIREWPFQS